MHLALVTTDGTRALHVDLRRGAPDLALDIVAVRPVGPDGPWDSLPIVEPVPLSGDRPVVLATSLPARTTGADVVVAWTADHSSGRLEGSHLFRLPPDRDVATPMARSGMLGGWTTLALAFALVLSTVLVLWSAMGSDDGDSAAAVPPVTAPSITPTIAPSTVASPTTIAASTPASTPTTTSLTPTTTASTTTSPTTTSPTSTSTTSTSTAPTSAPPADGPRVLVDARIEPCRFADDCLIVGFRLDGFTSVPTEYVCEFEDGSRFTFSFRSDGVEDACATGSADAAITVEIDGIRSDTVTRADATP